MLKSDVVKILSMIENELSTSSSRIDVIKKLRRLTFTDFSLFLLSMPNTNYPKISSKLPKMADDDVQRSWTGASGITLLQQSMDFLRVATFGFAEINERGLKKSKILDFGCGYGRLARLFYYFVDEEMFYGVDPWDKSLEICFNDGLTKNLYQSDWLPTSLPFANVKFDLIYAFSVFTHLSERATYAALNTLNKYLTDDGVLLITIRPPEYWDLDANAIKQHKSDFLKATHENEGFAFLAHNSEQIEGDVTYGDTSIKLEWLSEKFPHFKIVKTDYSLSDPYQLYVFLQAN
jgi:SAM-dependent methyltransferase